MAINRVRTSASTLLDGYRRVGGRLAVAVMVLSGVAFARRAGFDPDSDVTDFLAASSIPGTSSVIIATYALSLWLTGSGRRRVGHGLAAVVTGVSAALAVVGLGCDTGGMVAWCPEAGRWTQQLASTQTALVMLMLGVQSLIADSAKTIAVRVRAGTLTIAGVTAAGTATGVALGLGGWVPLVDIRPMRGLTAVLALMLVIASMGVRADRWPLARLVRSETDQAVVNHMLPWILAVPFLPAAVGIVGNWISAGPVTIAVIIAVGPTLMLLVALSVAVNEQRRSSQRLAVALRQYELTVEQSPIGIALVSPDGRFLAVNGELCRLFGRDRSTLMNMTVDELTHPDDLASDLENIASCLRGERNRYEMEKRYLLPDGRWLPTQLSKALVRDDDGQPVHFVSQVVDLTERRRVEDRLRDDAGRDPLTWVANRRGLEEWYDELESGTGIGVLYVDLDGFKPVNDRFGHVLGDRVLEAVADLLRSGVRAQDLVARIGGDEFVVVCDSMDGADEFHRLAARIQEAFDGTETVTADDGSAIPIRASVGAVWIDAGTTLSEALSEADHAMYTVKRSRRDLTDRHTHRSPETPLRQ